MAIDKKFLINLKGKDFVLFAGLLDLAHGMGLAGIETMVVKDLCSPNEDRWVVQAIGTFRPAEGKEATWSAYGDAHAGNSQMRGAYLRHAETRAVARMLRLATNVGMTAFEELGPDKEPERLQPGDPEVIPHRCERCGEDLPDELVGKSRYRFAGHLYCARHFAEMEEGTKAQGALVCSDCNVMVSEKLATAGLQSKYARVLCFDCAKKRKSQEKEAVGAAS